MFLRARQCHEKAARVFLYLLLGPAVLAGVASVDGAVDNHRVELQPLGFVYRRDDVALLERAAAHVGLLAGAYLGDVAFELTPQSGIEVGTYEVGVEVVQQMLPFVDRVYQLGVEQTAVSTLQLVDDAPAVGIIVQLRIAFTELGNLAAVGLHEKPLVGDHGCGAVVAEAQ